MGRRLRIRRGPLRGERVTTKDERVRAILCAADFLLGVAHGQYKRVPKAVREDALARLRHYPTRFDLEQMLNEDYLWHLK